MKKIYLTEEKRNEEERRTGKASYCTLVERYFDNMVICNNLLENYFDEIIDNMEIGTLYNEETGEYDEVYQTFIVDTLDEYSLESLKELEESNDDDSIILSYIPSLDLQVLLVTHWGTSWSYVNTNVKLTDNIWIY